MSIEIVVPFDPRPESCPVAGVATWAAGTAGPKVVFIDNRKVYADRLMRSMGDALVELGVISSYLLYAKDAMTPLDEQQRKEVAALGDVFVSGLGDCGGCTACSTTDAIGLLALGRPSFMLASTMFASIVDAVDVSMGVPGLRRLFVEHPVWTRDAAWFAATGDELANVFAAELVALQAPALAAG